MTLQVLTRDNNGVTFSDPAHPEYTFRTKTTKSKKNIGGTSVDNYVTEIIINDTNTISVGGNSAPDAVSIRLRLSGSGYSEARVNKILESIAAYVPKIVGGHTFLGFDPEAPAYPV